MGVTAHHCDIAIVGAGAVGGTLALALAKLGYSVTLIEKTAADAQQQPAFDERYLGLSRSTKLAFDSLGLWSPMAAQAAPVSRIHVTSKGHFGSLMVDAADEGIEALGYVLPARVIGHTLHQAIARQANLRLLAPAQVAAATTNNDAAVVKLDYRNEAMAINADLLVGADGAASRIRELFAIDTTRRQYHQQAIIANIAVDKHPPGLAYERFIDDGVAAVLPRNDAGVGVVLAVADHRAAQIMALNDDDFGAYLQTNFNGRLAKITGVGKRHCLPLALVRAKEVARERLVLVGSAAHHIHPVAAQGFNLSVRDIAALVETLHRASNDNRQLGELQVLQQYAAWRRRDERVMVAFTDGLARLCGRPLLPLACWRQQGMLALRYLPPLRRLFTRAVTGRLGRQAALLRGVSLSPHEPA